MDSVEHNNIVKDSQFLQKKWIDEIFGDYEALIANNIPEDAEDFIISLYEEEVYDCVEVKIDTDAQTGFFTIAQSINLVNHFWHFLENIVIGAEKSYWQQDQEGPEAGFVVSKLSNDKIRVTLISYGWWEFYKNKRGLHKVGYHNPQIPLDIVCSTKEFITKMYNAMKKIKYPKDNSDDPWYGAIKDSEIIKKYVKENTFSIDWDFGCGSFNYDDIEAYELDDIEEILDDKWQHNDNLLQIAILYKCNDTKLCHTMELCEIKWIEKDLLEKVKNNEKANYFERHCSCDFEFETTVINEKYIRLTITDKNEEPQIKFDEVILKNEFLSEMSRIFNEIERKTDELIDEYGNKNGLSSKEKEDLKTRLYEW